MKGDKVSIIDMTNLEYLKMMALKLNEKKVEIAKSRDEVRELLAELEGLVDSWDRGVEELNAGVRNIEDAIDALSEHV